MKNNRIELISQTTGEVLYYDIRTMSTVVNDSIPTLTICTADFDYHQFSLIEWTFQI